MFLGHLLYNVAEFILFLQPWDIPCHSC